MAGRVVFDIETNAIKNFKTLEGLEKIHCLVGENIDTGEKRSFVPREIADGVSWLGDADCLIGHNILRFDIPAIQKFFPHFKAAKVLDTLLLSRMAFPEIKQDDLKRRDFPSKLIGSHSLKSHGYRLGVLKGEFGADESDWQKFTPEMLAYCEQDVEVNVKLWFDLPTLPDDAVELEHQFAEIIRQQELNGFCFDVERAQRLYNRLAELRTALRKDLQDTFPAKRTEMKTPQFWSVGMFEFPDKYPTKAAAEKFIRTLPKGNKHIAVRGPNKVKIEPFNPDSRQQISRHLIEKYGWKPKVFSPTGLPKIDETILGRLKYPEAIKLARYLMLTKRIGQIAEGEQAWLKLEHKGRIHGSVNTIGAVTARCTHSNPNVSQVPATRKPLGGPCRSLFKASPGMVMLGADVAGLELRCLAHYMARWDGGNYAKILLEADIHTANQKAAGLATRDQAKTFIYAFLYGAGDEKIGSIVGGGAKAGKQMKAKFLRNLPALKYLRDGVTAVVKKQGFIRAIDKRPIPIRSSHSALNTLLQSCGAIIVKRATCIAAESFQLSGWWGTEVRQVAHIHDEVQYEANPEIAAFAGQVLVGSIIAAGETYGLRCPLDGEYKIGKTWKDTH